MANTVQANQTNRAAPITRLQTIPTNSQDRSSHSILAQTLTLRPPIPDCPMCRDFEVLTWVSGEGCSTLYSESVKQQWGGICVAGWKGGFLWEKSSESMTASTLTGGWGEVVRPVSFSPGDDPRP